MADGVNLIRICEVVSIDDNTDGNRIKVRISPREDFTPIDKLPWCVPLLPQMMHIKPKVGESVLILTAVAGRDMTLRYYIGPVISQMSHLPEEPALDAKRVSPTNTERHDPATTNDVDLTNGSLPNDDDIAILGRKNSDVILTDNDVRVRCGVKLVKPENQRGFVFNTSNPSYLKLKYYEDGLDEQKKIHSTATLVADKINLIGRIIFTFLKFLKQQVIPGNPKSLTKIFEPSPSTLKGTSCSLAKFINCLICSSVSGKAKTSATPPTL